jgi:hypothetical protein
MASRENHTALLRRIDENVDRNLQYRAIQYREQYCDMDIEHILSIESIRTLKIGDDQRKEVFDGPLLQYCTNCIMRSYNISPYARDIWVCKQILIGDEVFVDAGEVVPVYVSERVGLSTAYEQTMRTLRESIPTLEMIIRERHVPGDNLQHVADELQDARQQLQRLVQLQSAPRTREVLNPTRIEKLQTLCRTYSHEYTNERALVFQFNDMVHWSLIILINECVEYDMARGIFPEQHILYMDSNRDGLSENTVKEKIIGMCNILRIDITNTPVIRINTPTQGHAIDSHSCGAYNLMFLKCFLSVYNKNPYAHHSELERSIAQNVSIEQMLQFRLDCSNDLLKLQQTGYRRRPSTIRHGGGHYNKYIKYKQKYMDSVK